MRDDCNRIATAARAVYGVNRFGGSRCAIYSMPPFELNFTTHVSRALASLDELRSLRATLTVFRRCPAMVDAGDALNDFAVLHARAPVALLAGITPPQPPAGAYSFNSEYQDLLAANRLWDATTHTLDAGVVRVMAAGQLPGGGAGFSMCRDCGGDRGSPGDYDVTMQVLLDAQEDERGGVAFPAEQRAARMVFTSSSGAFGRDDVAEILGTRTAWSSEHDAAAAAGGAAHG